MTITSPHGLIDMDENTELDQLTPRSQFSLALCMRFSFSGTRQRTLLGAKKEKKRLKALYTSNVCKNINDINHQPNSYNQTI